MKDKDKIQEQLISELIELRRRIGELEALETQHKQAEEAAKLAYVELNQIFHAAGDGIRVIDRDFNMLRVNKTFLTLSGVSKDETVGRKCYELFRSPLCHTPNCPLTQILAGKRRFECEVGKERNDGIRIPCILTANPIYGPGGDLIGIVEVFKNITEYKKAEEALRKIEASLTEAQRITHLGNWDWDIIDNKLWWSDEIYRIFGLAPQDFGATYEAFLNSVHPDDRQFVKKSVNEALYKGKPYNIDHRVVLPDGSERIVHEQAKIFFDRTGRAIRMVGTVQDITEHKQAEEELKRSRQQLRDLTRHLQSVREEERSRVAREIHDELGQALTALKMDLSWLDKGLPRDQKSLLERIKSMSKLIDTTMGTVKRISAELRPGLLDDLGLIAAVEWQAVEFQNRTGIKCKVTVDPGDIILDKDLSTAIFRIFQETLTNVARHASATRIKASLKEKSGKLELKVRDNGRGITEKQISDPKSFGLIGMRERVHFYGGEVKIRGARYRGSTITVSIPLRKKGETQ